MARKALIGASAALLVVAVALGAVFRHPAYWALATVALGVLLAAAPRRSSWHPWFALALLVLLVGTVVYGQLDAVLRSMHVFGHPSYGLASIGSRGGEPKAAFDAVQGWSTWHHQPGLQLRALYASPAHVASLALWVDFLLIVPGYLAGVGLLLLRGRRNLEKHVERKGRHDDLPRERAARTFGWIGSAGLGFAVLMDLLENLSYAQALRTFWSASNDGAGSTFARALIVASGWFTLGKTVGLVVALVGLAAVAVGLDHLGREHDRGGELWRALAALRGQITVTVLFGLLLVAHPQATDVIRRWNVRQAVVAVVLAILLAFVAWALARRLLSPTPWRGEGRKRPVRSHLLLAGGGSLVASLVLRLLGAPAWGLLVPAVFWLVVGAAQGRIGDLPPARLDRLRFGRLALPKLVGASVVVILGLSVLRASVGTFVLEAGRSSAGPLLATGLALLPVAWGLYLLLGTERISYGRLAALRERRRRAGWSAMRADPLTWVAAAAFGVGILLWLRLVQNAWAVTGLLGTVGVLEAFLIVASFVLAGLMMLSEWVEPPELLKVFRFRRFPVFTLLVAWFFLASVLPVGGGYHDVRFITSPAGRPALVRAETPASVLSRWLRGLPADVFSGAPPGGRRAVPLILVATAGGGIRAAYWTSLVLDCVFRAVPVSPACRGGPGIDQTPFVLAASGISGGSVGLVSYLAHQIRASPTADGRDWVASRLGGDYLSSSLGWELAVELPRALFRFDPGMDRAEVIERSLQQSWVAGPWSPGWVNAALRSSPDEDRGPLTQGFFRVWERGSRSGGPAVPLLLLNGTSVTDGCRFNTSALDADGNDGGRAPNPRAPDCLATETFTGATPSTVHRVLAATRDLEDDLCETVDGVREDVRLSTAAFLSARFPYVSPSGRIPACGAPSQATYVVDGGYLDSSGASTIEEFWNQLEPLVARYNAGDYPAGQPASSCLVPYLIQIDNGYDEPHPAASTRRPGELTVPLKAALSARSAFSSLAREVAAVTFSRGDLSAGVTRADRYAHFFTQSHPGVEAPLGWVLSNDAQRDLHRQLRENQSQLAKVRSWLAASSCG